MNFKIKLLAIFFLSFLTLGITKIQAQRTPKLRCLAVHIDGSVSLYFIAPTDSSQFISYSVYCSNDRNAPFDLVAGSLTTFNSQHFDGIDSIVHNYYYIRAIYQGGNYYDSDTMSVIHTTVVNPGDGTALISWIPPDPLLPTTAKYYEVMVSERTPYNYQLRGIVPLSSPLSFRDTINICYGQIYYRIQLEDEFLNPNRCRHVSTVGSDIFMSKIPPPVPTLTSVSVDVPTGNIVISWTSSPHTDVGHYIIFHSTSGSAPWVPIDTVYGRLNTSYTDMLNSSDVIQFYRISTRDSCGNSSAQIPFPQSNMVLNITSDPCTRKATLSWNPYTYMTDGLQKYEIWVSIDGAPYTFVAQVGQNITNYTYSNLIPNTSYSFYIKAINATSIYTANSNKFDFDFSVEDRNDFIYLSSVSVENTNEIHIEFITSGNNFAFDKIQVYRSEENTSNFVHVGDIAYAGIAKYTYTDVNMNVAKTYYYYKAQLISECSPEPISSNIAHHIILTGVGNEAHVNNLQWMNYDDNVASTPQNTYAVYRKMETDLRYVEIESSILTSQYINYSDDVSELYNFGSDFKYKVTTNETLNEFGVCSPSSSNEITLNQKPTTYIPTAFNPSGINNNIFLPINSFVTTSNYIFRIFDRWGGILFETFDPYTGWNGTTTKGEQVPQGMYIYVLEYTYGDEVFTKTGTVTLIR